MPRMQKLFYVHRQWDAKDHRRCTFPFPPPSSYLHSAMPKVSYMTVLDWYVLLCMLTSMGTILLHVLSTILLFDWKTECVLALSWLGFFASVHVLYISLVRQHCSTSELSSENSRLGVSSGNTNRVGWFGKGIRASASDFFSRSPTICLRGRAISGSSGGCDGTGAGGGGYRAGTAGAAPQAGEEEVLSTQRGVSGEAPPDASSTIGVVVHTADARVLVRHVDCCETSNDHARPVGGVEAVGSAPPTGA